MPTLCAFVEAVRKTIGTPVVHMGRLPQRALDCVGVPWAACLDLGLQLAPIQTYNVMPSGDELTAGLALFCDPVEVGGHIWQVYMGREPRHVVVPVGVNDCGQVVIVHAWGDGRRVCETVASQPVARRWNIRGIG